MASIQNVQGFWWSFQQVGLIMSRLVRITIGYISRVVNCDLALKQVKSYNHNKFTGKGA